MTTMIKRRGVLLGGLMAGGALPDMISDRQSFSDTYGAPIESLSGYDKPDLAELAFRARVRDINARDLSGYRGDYGGTGMVFDSDLQAMKSLSLSAKQRIQQERNLAEWKQNQIMRAARDIAEAMDWIEPDKPWSTTWVGKALDLLKS